METIQYNFWSRLCGQGALDTADYLPWPFDGYAAWTRISSKRLDVLDRARDVFFGVRYRRCIRNC